MPTDNVFQLICILWGLLLSSYGKLKCAWRQDNIFIYFNSFCTIVDSFFHTYFKLNQYEYAMFKYRYFYFHLPPFCKNTYFSIDMSNYELSDICEIEILHKNNIRNTTQTYIILLYPKFNLISLISIKILCKHIIK